MSSERIPLQPSLKRLLELEALSEAKVLCGKEFLDRPITQVVATLFGGQRAGTLCLLKASSISTLDPGSLKGTAGLIIIQQVSSIKTAASKGSVKSQVLPELALELESVLKICQDAGTPLVVLPCLEDSMEIIEEIRSVYLNEVKKANARLHAYFIRLVIEEGLETFVETLSDQLARPCAVETSDFKLLAAHNMGPTPANQQKTLTEELGEVLNRELRELDELKELDSLLDPIRVGRRLVAPIIFEGSVVGYFSVMLRPSDDEEFIGEYLRPATLAALVDFGNRRREFATNTMSHRSLLKDLLLGHSLAGSDQERLEQYFGLDICDGSLVFALRLTPENLADNLTWNEDRQAMVEMEDVSVFVLPVERKDEMKWQDYAQGLKDSLKQKIEGLNIQMGVSRLAPTLLDLPDAYKEARQALITGDMMHGKEEFMIEYGELGIKRILYLMFDHPELDRYYHEHLAPLEAYDAEWETELVETLKVYLEQGYNLNSAAKELFVHRHTMRYRLEQIAELLKVDIDSPEVLLNLQIAFQIREMKGRAE